MLFVCLHFLCHVGQGTERKTDVVIGIGFHRSLVFQPEVSLVLQCNLIDCFHRAGFLAFVAKFALNVRKFGASQDFLFYFPLAGGIVIGTALHHAVAKDFRHLAGRTSQKLQQPVTDEFVPDGMVLVFPPGGNVRHGRVGGDVATAEEPDGLSHPFFEIVAVFTLQDASAVITVKDPVEILLIAHEKHPVTEVRGCGEITLPLLANSPQPLPARAVSCNGLKKL